MKKRRCFTLLEMVVVMVLAGVLLTGLFHSFYCTLKSRAQNRELKQAILSLELFEQKVKHLLSKTKKVWTVSDPKTKEVFLYFQFTPDVDAEWDTVAERTGKLHLDAKHQLWFDSTLAKDKMRSELLLEQVDAFSCRFFDPQKKEWKDEWPEKAGLFPAFFSIKLNWRKKEIPFTFFPPNPAEQISYQG